MQLSIVIPTFNEERRLPLTLRDIRQFLNDQNMEATTEVIIADDGSSDGTVAFVKGLMVHWPQLRVLTLPHSGKGGAVHGGVMAAVGLYIFLCDADLSMPIEELPKFIPPLSGDYDILIGSRAAPGAERIDEPVLRHAMSRVFNTLVRISALPGIADTQCGFKSMKRHVAHHLFGEMTLSGFGFDVELLALARLRGYTMAEVPIRWIYGAESRVRPVHDTIKMAREVMSVRVRVRNLSETDQVDDHTVQERLRRFWAEQKTQVVPNIADMPTLAIDEEDRPALNSEGPQEILFWTLHDTQEVVLISMPPATTLPEDSTPGAWSRTGELPNWLIDGEVIPDTQPRLPR